jgi:hypothetical protein
VIFKNGDPTTVITVIFECGDDRLGLSDIYGKTPVSTAVYGGRRQPPPPVRI